MSSQFMTVKSGRITSAANTTIIVVKAIPGTLYGWNLFNTSAAKSFVKIYNAVAATVGTTTPILTIGIPAGTRSDVFLPFPMWLSAGINVGITTLIADSDTTAPAALDITGQMLFL
jgi:hypothetical protein